MLYLNCVTYKSYNQNDSLLFPHSIGNFIPENDPVRVLDVIVEHLDISAIEANANKYTLVWKKATKTNQDKLEIVGDRGSYSKTDKDATFMRMKA